MSSALAMVLMATMAVPANGPELVSAEMREEIHLDGKWVGIWQDSAGRRYQLSISDGSITGAPRSITIMDEHEGRLRIDSPGTMAVLGIGEQRGDHVVICYADPGYPRPRHIQASSTQGLIVLHCVKPGK